MTHTPLFPIVLDALKLRRKIRNARTHETRSRARVQLRATLASMTARARLQFYAASAAEGLAPI